MYYHAFYFVLKLLEDTLHWRGKTKAQEYSYNKCI